MINTLSGNRNIDIDKELDQFCNKDGDLPHTRIHLPEDIDCEILKQQIFKMAPERVIAIGGDGTIKLIAEMLTGTDIALGIVPAGSANGMAKDLDLPLKIPEALERAVYGTKRKIHLININNELCIHLSDIGFNAYVVKKFDSLGHRGMLGYIKAAWKVLWKHARMKVVFSINGRTVEREAVMVVLANATSYGTGVRINPDGRLDDKLFEVVIVRKISITEILKMSFTRMAFNPRKTEVIQTDELLIKSRKKVHFQVDGEYQGKVNEIKAVLIPEALQVIS